MREYTKKPESQSRTLESTPKASRQAPIDVILQRYKEQNIQRSAEGKESIQGKFDTAQREEIDEDELLQGKFESVPFNEQESAQREEKNNNTGLPDNLKTGIEVFSGYGLDGVKVHYNSEKPAQLQALAYTQGTDIHIAPGQEKHLPHEAWHVVQQMQGRVQPTMQTQGVNVNDSEGLEREADVMGGKLSICQLLVNSHATKHTSSISFDYPIIQLLKLNTGSGIIDIDIEQLTLERIYDYLGRINDHKVTFEENDIDRLRDRAGILLQPAFMNIRTAQQSDSDLGVLRNRNVQISGADQQMLLDFMLVFSATGNLKGLDSWIATVSAQESESRQDHMNELWEVARQYFFHGVDKFDISEKMIPGTVQTADITAENLQVEVKTVRDPISKDTELQHQIAAGLSKFAGVPHDSTKKYEVSVYASFRKDLLEEDGLQVNPKIKIKVNPNTLIQTKIISTPEGKKIIEDCNYPTQLTDFLNMNSSIVTRVNIIMENSRSYYAEQISPQNWNSHII